MIFATDIDSTLNDHWRRVERNTEDGCILPSACEKAEWLQDRPLTLAVAAVAAFRESWGQAWVVTAREWDLPDGRATETWLHMMGFVVDGVIVVPNAAAKVGVLREMRPDLYVDDFTFGQEFTTPGFDCRTYNAIRDIGSFPVEPFRNNWREIARRHLGVDLLGFN